MRCIHCRRMLRPRPLCPAGQLHHLPAVTTNRGRIKVPPHRCSPSSNLQPNNCGQQALSCLGVHTPGLHSPRGAPSVLSTDILAQPGAAWPSPNARLAKQRPYSPSLVYSIKELAGLTAWRCRGSDRPLHSRRMPPPPAHQPLWCRCWPACGPLQQPLRVPGAVKRILINPQTQVQMRQPALVSWASTSWTSTAAGAARELRSRRLQRLSRAAELQL